MFRLTVWGLSISSVFVFLFAAQEGTLTERYSSLPLAPGNHYTTFYLYEFDYFRNFLLVESYNICLFVLYYVFPL